MIDPELVGLNVEDVTEAKEALKGANLPAGGDIALLVALHERLGDLAFIYGRDAGILPFRSPLEPQALAMLVHRLEEALLEYGHSMSIPKEELEVSKRRILEWFDRTFPSLG